jgi:transcriptional regulator with XRE-family HTH domain
MKQVLTKKELCEALGVSPSTLRRWLNEEYYGELSESGYQKKDRILKPKVMKWLCTHLDIDV